jgi:hypothetical protein
MSPSTPDWLIERLAQGELDEEAAADVRRRLAAEGRAPDEVVAALQASNRELLQAHPTAAMTEAIRRRAAAAQARPRRARMPLFLFGGPALAAAAVAVALLVGRVPTPTPQVPKLEETGIKGDTHPVGYTHLVVYRHHPDGDEPLSDGAQAARGDLLQLEYVTASPSWGVLLSIDGAGKVTLHWPDSGAAGEAPALPAKRMVRVPSAYELDDAPGFERFFFVTGARPFAIASVVEAARTLAARPAAAARTAPLPVAAELRQISLALDKPRPHSRKEAP